MVESGRAGIRYSEQLTPLIKPFPRKVELLALTEVIDEAMRLFNPEILSDRSGSDAWLGPRLHAALRLTRAEAAADEVWYFLAAYAFPDYVTWRWRDPRALSNRMFGKDVKKQAFKRLWWTAELFRNGSSYATAERAFSQSDIANTLTGIDAMHSRPVALGTLEFVEKNDVGSREINSFTKQLDSSAVTVALDRAFMSQDEAGEVDEAWLVAEPDLQEVIKAPVGPRNGKVDQKEIERVYETLKEIIELEVLRNYRKSGSDSEIAEREAKATAS